MDIVEELIKQAEESIKKSQSKAVSLQEMTELKLECLCNCMLSYSPEKEFFKQKIDEILNQGPPFTTKQIANALLDTAKFKKNRLSVSMGTMMENDDYKIYWESLKRMIDERRIKYVGKETRENILKVMDVIEKEREAIEWN